MLKSITIKNFKKIGEGWITLSKLGRVNYLVGENSCGKSSVLEAIYSKLKNIKYKLFPDMNVELNNGFWMPLMLVHKNNILNNSYSTEKLDWSIGSISLPSTGDKYLKQTDVIEYSNLDILNMSFDWYNSNVDLEQSLKYKLINFINIILQGESKIVNIKKEIWIPEKWETTLQFYVEHESWNKVNLNFLAWWYIYLIKLIILLTLEVYSDKTIICIEEPEQQLNPKIQKLLPQLFKHLLNSNLNLQFFISTHSPFIISAAAEFSDQKVYLIEDGQTKSLTKSWDWSKWFPASKAKQVAASMLWAWISDLVRDKKIKTSKNAPLIIFCEWEENDANVYNIIFRWYKKRSVMFISATWCGQAIDSSKILSNIKSCLWNFEIKTLIDHDDKTPDEILELKKLWVKVLDRYEIENYLYDPIVLNKFDSSSKKFESKFSIIWNLKRISDYWKFKNKHTELAQIIYDNKSDWWPIQDLYQELEKCIFGESEITVISPSPSITQLH